MKVLFLDFDGVLNSSDWLRKRQSGLITALGGEMWEAMIDPAMAARLHDVLAFTGAKVVVSSSWRHACTRQQLQGFLAHHGCVADVIGTTPILSDVRGAEISAWLKTYEVSGLPTITRIAIIDDDSDITPFESRWVRTYFRPPDSNPAQPLGLSEQAAEQLKALLGPACDLG
jgi:HAD domain in Swiss Army Knife RNA repair proteins